jgi:hypothetical protein
MNGLSPWLMMPEWGQMQAATWQFLMLLDYVDLIPISEVEFLLGYYGKETRLEFWTSNYTRMEEIIERLDESVHK